MYGTNTQNPIFNAGLAGSSALVCYQVLGLVVLIYAIVAVATVATVVRHRSRVHSAKRQDVGIDAILR